MRSSWRGLIVTNYLGTDAIAIIALPSQYGQYGYRRSSYCWTMPGGMLASIGCSGSGAVMGPKYPRNRSHEAGSGSTMDRSLTLVRLRCDEGPSSSIFQPSEIEELQL